MSIRQVTPPAKIGVETVSEELIDLSHAGYTRIVLDFTEVERLTSRIVGVVMILRQHCQASVEGQLRLCGLRPEVAQVFILAGLGEALPIDPDVRSALEAPWPDAPRPRPLPIAVLDSLREKPTNGTRSASMTITSRPESPSTVAEVSERTRIHLSLLAGSARGRSNRVLGAEILIGRDPTCDIRVEDSQASRRHAVIQVQGRRVLLRDLGSTNGTRHNGESVQGRQVELVDGDRIHIGSVSWMIRIDSGASNREPDEDRVATWLRDDAVETGEFDGSTREVSITDAPDADAEGSETPPGWLGEAGQGLIRAEMIDTVLILTPMLSRFEDDTAIDAFREVLVRFIDTSVSRRVAVDLSNVTHVSSRAIGVLLACHLRLERGGGALRLCHVPARVHATFDRIRLPMLVGTFPSVDDAVITAWE